MVEVKERGLNLELIDVDALPSKGDTLVIQYTGKDQPLERTVNNIKFETDNCGGSNTIETPKKTRIIVNVTAKIPLGS